MSWTKVEEEVKDVTVTVEGVEWKLEQSEKNNAEAMAEVALKLSKGKVKQKPKADMVNHPPHYTSHPSGVECIQITEHMGFNLGNALKYIWRADLKGSAVEDLEKAVFYINRELEKRKSK
jgi:hypothetical protein